MCCSGWRMACYCYQLLVGGNMRQWNSEQKMEIIRVEIIIARPWIGTQLTRSGFCHSLPNLIFVGTHEYFVNILNRLQSWELEVGWWSGGNNRKLSCQTNADHDIAFRLDKLLESDWSVVSYSLASLRTFVKSVVLNIKVVLTWNRLKMNIVTLQSFQHTT